MTRFIFKRLLISILIVWGVFTVIFIIIHLAPGDPVSMYTSPDISKLATDNLRHQLGLDRSLLQQYRAMVVAFARGNFGFSLSHKRPVNNVLSEAILNTLQLTGVVFLLQFLFGPILGIFSALMKGRKPDNLINGILLVFYSLPGFWLALMVVMFFSYYLGWLPSGQMSTLGLEGDNWSQFIDRLRHLVLPATVLSLPFIAYTARFVRGSFADALSKEFVTTAFAYGLSRRTIYFKYVMKNAMLPLATLSGMYFPFLLGGAVITEYIFAWPGMGQLTIEAIFTHDYPLILASTIIAAFSVIAGNFVSDILYFFIDPRIKPERV